MLNRLKKILKSNPERKEYAARYLQELHAQARILHVPGGILGLVAWLGFALDTDARLHPEFPELFYFRIALSVISALELIAVIVDRIAGRPLLRGKGLGWLLIQYGYVLLSTAWFTGRIADDANYVSGLQIVVMIMAFIPFPRRVMYGTYLLSLFVFLGSVLIHEPELNTVDAEYSMQNLAIAYMLGFILAYVFDRFRFKVFYNHLKVVEKSRELQEQMERVHALKVQQDGDYYLTSILIQPLVRNDVGDGGPVSVQLYLNQKKKFAFRSRESEIGGDYLYADTIHLGGRPYTAFVNGDAMGKSIQGAGGALVFGTVFRSVVTRTGIAASYMNKSPEKWLKDCFGELQNVFVTFDGSMLVSAIIGLIDNENGVLYFLNAEHPWPVLYRDGAASFLAGDSMQRKIGISGLDKKLSIRVLRLRRDDVLVLGSDGRDDIDIGKTDDDQRIINENEEEFLRRVEEGRGEIQEIVAAILRQGQLTDDLSLMRIAHREDTPAEDPRSHPESERIAGEARAAFEQDPRRAERLLHEGVEKAPQDARLVKLLAGLKARAGDFAGAAQFCERYVELRPEDTEFLDFSSRTLKRRYAAERRPEFLVRAVDFGERCRLRAGTQVAHLVHLADAYRLLGNRARALKILEEALELDPERSSARKLARLLES